MKNARDILYKVSYYLSLAFAILWAVVCGICLIFGLIGIITGAIQMVDNSDGGAGTLAAGIGEIITAICFAVAAVCSFINMGLSKKAPVDDTKKTYITSIVFSVLSGTEVGIVGAIFGLILLNQAENAQANNDNVVDAKVEEAKPAEETKEVAPVEEAKEETPAEETKTDDKPADSSDAE